jgi:hypothetical protein
MLREQPVNDAPVHVGQAEVSAAVAERELFMVEAHQVQNSGVQVVDVDFVLGGSETEFIRGTVGGAAFDSASRDHNGGAFTAWLAGGGIKGGVGFGATDDLGYKAAENPTYSYDLYATALHLLGLDHEKLTFYHNGIQRRLTDVHGHVITDLLT